MAYTNINSEDRLVQATFAEHLEEELGWENVYAWNDETFGADGTLGRGDTREVVLTRDLQRAIQRLNPELPPAAVQEAIGKITQHDFSRSLLAHNQAFYKFIRYGVPVSFRDATGELRHHHSLTKKSSKWRGGCTSTFGNKALRHNRSPLKRHPSRLRRFLVLDANGAGYYNQGARNSQFGVSDVCESVYWS